MGQLRPSGSFDFDDVSLLVLESSGAFGARACDETASHFSEVVFPYERVVEEPDKSCVD